MSTVQSIWLRLAAPLWQLLSKFLLLCLGLVLTAAVVLGVFILSMLPILPNIESEEHTALKVPLRVYSRESALLGEFGDEKRNLVTIEDVPPLLIKAILAAEDDRFYEHIGIDVGSIMRAFIINLRAGSVRQGASTITMQVARNYFLTPEKTYTRKIKEMLLSFELERRFTKDQILELYINKIFLGHRAYGFSTAARTYYDKDMKDLSLAQLAMLAGMLKAPSRDNPISNPLYAQARRDYVLDRMLQERHIGQEQHQKAISAKLTAKRHGPRIEYAPYIAEMARVYMIEKYGQRAYSEGYRVYTTISTDLQTAARDALRITLESYDKRHGYRGALATMNELANLEDGNATKERALFDQKWRQQLARYPAVGGLLPVLVMRVHERSAEAMHIDGKRIVIHWNGMKWARPQLRGRTLGAHPSNAGEVLRRGEVVYVKKHGALWNLAQVPNVAGALISLDANDGAIQSVVGGYDFRLSKFNRAVQAERQPGSNIKPFIYSAALEKGFTAASKVSDSSIVIVDSQGNIWRPENYSKKTYGPLPLRTALSKSLNLVSVRLLRAITPKFGVEHLQRFGFEEKDMPSGLPLALGAASFTPLEIVRGYAVFANGGYLVKPYFVSYVEDRDGHIVERANPTVVCEYCDAGDADAHTTSAEDTAAVRQLAPRVISEANAFIMNDLLREVVRSGTAVKALSLKRGDLGGKTGTTNDFHDAWFSGFNRNLATTIWVGFDQSRSMGNGEAGSRAALPGWIAYMKTALQGLPQQVLEPPDNVIRALVDANGKRTDEDNGLGRGEYFIAGTVPLVATADDSEGGALAPTDSELF